ncbi:hypothetical protein HMPREF1548_05355 [Clostridium sp. KLE 1755]|nr:hypothetical protein HMPREF1548_05355 [Clostridium sp. KLE 1755]
MWLSCPMPFWERFTSVKIDNRRTSTVWDCPMSCYFSGSMAKLLDIFSTS